VKTLLLIIKANETQRIRITGGRRTRRKDGRTRAGGMRRSRRIRRFAMLALTVHNKQGKKTKNKKRGPNRTSRKGTRKAKIRKTVKKGTGNSK